MASLKKTDADTNRSNECEEPDAKPRTQKCGADNQLRACMTYRQLVVESVAFEKEEGENGRPQLLTRCADESGVFMEARSTGLLLLSHQPCFDPSRQTAAAADERD
jgi:hypothetical protein